MLTSTKPMFKKRQRKQTKEEKAIAHDKRKAKEAEAKMNLHQAKSKSEHTAEKQAPWESSPAWPTPSQPTCSWNWGRSQEISRPLLYLDPCYII